MSTPTTPTTGPARATATGPGRPAARGTGVRPLEMIGVVARREALARLRDRVFLFSTGFFILFVAASVAVPLLVSGDDGPPRYELAATGPAALAVAETARAAGAQVADAEEAAEAGDDGTTAVLDGEASPVPAARVQVREVADLAAAEAAVRAGQVDAALVTAGGGATGVRLIGDDEVPYDLTLLIGAVGRDSALRSALGSAGLSAAESEQVTAALAATVPQRLLDPPSDDTVLAQVLGAGFALLFFFTVFIFGFTIAQSVVEEKQSRVVELLVSTIPVRWLLFGKLLGAGALALGQIVLLLAVGLAVAAATGESALVGLVLGNAGWFLAFFVVGFAMLSGLWAVSGSVANRQEDLQGTTLPMQLVVGVPFFLTLWISEPGPWLTTLSYVPLSAPVAMPLRLVTGDAAWWEGVLSAGLMAAFGVLVVLVAARLYEGSLLRTSGKVPLLAAWRGSGS